MLLTFFRTRNISHKGFEKTEKLERSYNGTYSYLR
nr:MAG TPA: hypothetical protein [Caudoviricetes sp.]